jgi:glycerol-3-phosphate dehydrogenase (NAD(P)+)
MSFSHIGIVGAGSWGTALALLLQENGHAVTLWGHDAAQIAQVAAERENRPYLPGIPLPEAMQLTSQLEDLAPCDLILLGHAVESAP